MSVPYVSVDSKKLPKKLLSDSKETKYWKRFEKVHSAVENYSVNVVTCENVRNYFAMATGHIVQVYDANKNVFKTKIEKFKSGVVSGVSFRNDGKVLAVGEGDGRFHIIETKSRAILRSFRRHKEAVHALRFLPDASHIATGSDDFTCKIFDISTRSMVRDFQEIHHDYIRSIRVLAENQNLLLVGSYDKRVSLLDLRVVDQTPVHVFEHQFPIEDMDVFSDANRFVTVGGPVATIWDVRQNKVVGSSVNNLKTVTRVRVTSNDQRIITGSIDQQLKILDPENFEVHYQEKFHAGIMSFDITKKQTHMAFGLNDGHLEIRRRQNTEEEAKVIAEEERTDIALPKIEGKHKKIIRNYRFFYRGIYEKPTEFDQQFEYERKRKLQEFDKYMKKFQYKQAFMAVLKKKNINLTLGIIEELVQRDALDIALRNSTPAELETIFEFLEYNLTDPNLTTVLVPFADKLLDIYALQTLEDSSLRAKFNKLSNQLDLIIQEKNLMMNLLGKLELILDSNIIQSEDV